MLAGEVNKLNSRVEKNSSHISLIIAVLMYCTIEGGGNDVKKTL